MTGYPYGQSHTGGDDLPAVREYEKHTRIADEILSEQYATTLHAASVPREYADADIAALTKQVEELERANEKQRATLAAYDRAPAVEYKVEMLRQSARAEAAEASLKHSLRFQRENLDRALKAEAENAALRGEVERLAVIVHALEDDEPSFVESPFKKPTRSQVRRIAEQDQGNRCIYCHELAQDCECERRATP